MDIQMPVLTGLQVLQALAGDSHQPAVIFTTAYDEHALTAFELHAVDYLLKPFTHERFVEAIGHVQRDARTSLAGAVDALQAPDGAPLTRVLVRDQGRIFPINVDAIEHLRSDTKYTALARQGAAATWCACPSSRSSRSSTRPSSSSCTAAASSTSTSSNR
jgi:Response regulator of the LytR/AlgR family